MSHHLLVTKLYRPSVRQNLVHRRRLTQFLDESWQQGTKLTLVSPPAGYGKTTLVAAWLRSLQTKSAWLSLDRADNDPARFLIYLITALQQVDEGIGKNTQVLLQSPQPLPPEIVLTSLINEIAAAPSAFILVLDDYHLIEALPIYQQFDFLVEHQPLQMHLVIITREDPPLPLARLDSEGVVRFKVNKIIRYLVNSGRLNLNDIAAMQFSQEDREQLAQLIGYSLSGFGDLSYVSDETYKRATTQQVEDE